MSSKRLVLSSLLILTWNLSLDSVSGKFPALSICKDCKLKSTTFYTARNEIFSLKFTGASVQVIAPPNTNDTITGGIFGDDLYIFYKLIFFWKTDPVTKKAALRVGDIFYNSKYQNYKNALNYPDGIAQVCITIDANGNTYNPFFSTFAIAFNKVKTNPGKITCIKSTESYSWFKNFPPEVTYTYFRSSYREDDTGKSYSCATTIEVSAITKISKAQFLGTFGSLTDTSLKPLNNPPIVDIPTSPVGYGWGLPVIGVNA